VGGKLADAPPQARPVQAQDHLRRRVRDPPETLRIRREFQSSDETQGDDAQVNDQAGSRTAIQQLRRSTSKTAPQPPHRMQLGNMHQMKYAAEDPDRRQWALPNIAQSTKGRIAIPGVNTGSLWGPATAASWRRGSTIASPSGSSPVA
jgi:hypothetical protein